MDGVAAEKLQEKRVIDFTSSPAAASHKQVSDENVFYVGLASLAARGERNQR